MEDVLYLQSVVLHVTLYLPKSYLMLTAQEALLQTKKINSLRKKKPPFLDPFKKEELLHEEFLKLQDSISSAIQQGRYSCYHHLDARIDQEVRSWLKSHHYSIKSYNKSFLPEERKLTWVKTLCYLGAFISLMGIPLLLSYNLLGRRYGKINIKIVWRDSRTVRIY